MAHPCPAPPQPSGAPRQIEMAWKGTGNCHFRRQPPPASPTNNRPRPPLATMARRPPAPSVERSSSPKDASGSVRKAAARRPGGQVVGRLPNPSSPAQAPSMSARPVKPATSASSAATTVTLGAVASGRAGCARTATNLWPSATSSPLNSSPRHELPHDGEREPTWSQCNLHGRKSRSNKL